MGSVTEGGGGWEGVGKGVGRGREGGKGVARRQERREGNRIEGRQLEVIPPGKGKSSTFSASRRLWWPLVHCPGGWTLLSLVAVGKSSCEVGGGVGIGGGWHGDRGGVAWG